MASRAHLSVAVVLPAVALVGLGPATVTASGLRGVDPPLRVRHVEQVQIEVASPTAHAGDEVQVTLHVLDDQGAPVDAAGVALECFAASVGPLTRSGEGVHRATLTVPRQLPRERSAVLFAKADGWSSERAVSLAPGPASTLELSGPAAVSVREEGYFTVSILDAFGNAADEEPHARARAGPLAVRRVGAGLWTVEYAPRSPLDGPEDEIVVEAGEARGSRTIRLTRSGRWLAVAPWMGAALGRLTGLAAGASASAWWLSEPDELGLVLDAGWWRLSEQSAAALPGGAADVAVDRSYAPLTAAFAWTHAFTPRLFSTASAGAGGALVSASQRLSGQPSVTETGWAPAATAGAALGYRLRRGAAFLEARGVWIGDPHLSTMTGSSTALLLVGGYRYDAR